VAPCVERQTSNQEVVGSTPGRMLLCNHLRQVVSPRSISWYRCKIGKITASHGRLVVYCLLHWVLAHCWLMTMETEMSCEMVMLANGSLYLYLYTLCVAIW